MSRVYTAFPKAALLALPADRREEYLRFHVATEILMGEGARRIEKHYVVNCCISATKIASLLYDHAGIQNRGIVVDAMAMNAAYTDTAERLFGRMPVTMEEVEQVSREGIDTFISMIRVAPVEERMPEGQDVYGGHVVCLAQERVEDVCYLLDLTLPQMNGKSDGKLQLKPWVQAISEAFVDGDERASFPVMQHTGQWALVSYQAYPVESDFTETTAWQDDERLILSSLTRRFDREMEAHIEQLEALDECST